MSQDDGSDGGSGNEPEVVHLEYDWGQTEPSVAIVEAVANVSGREPTAMRPLFEVLDPDAIDSLLPSGNEAHDGSLSVSLRFDGYDVTVDDRGSVTIATSAGSDDPDDVMT
ncbi:MAG: HalOD1 output domain-containing protein [Halorientalis sp.]